MCAKNAFPKSDVGNDVRTRGGLAPPKPFSATEYHRGAVTHMASANIPFISYIISDTLWNRTEPTRWQKGDRTKPHQTYRRQCFPLLLASPHCICCFSASHRCRTKSAHNDASVPLSVAGKRCRGCSCTNEPWCFWTLVNSIETTQLNFLSLERCRML